MKKSISIAIVFLFIMLIQFNGNAQSKSIYFEHITKNNGLASNRVNCIYQDSTGFIWIGTADGLQKYEGYTFESFQYDPENILSISDNRINCIAKDTKNDNLWIGTENGLNYFDRNSHSFTKVIYTSDSIGLTSNQIYSLCTDKKNRLWIGTTSGICRMDLNSGTFYDFSSQAGSSNGLFNTNIYSIVEDSKDNIWIGTRLGLYKYNANLNSFSFFASCLAEKEIHFIYEDQIGSYWIGTNTSGIYRFKNGDSENDYEHYNMDNSALMNNRAYCITGDNVGNIYIGIRDGGLLEYNLTSKKFVPYIPDIYNENSLNSKALLTIFRDRDGIIWIGTYSSGLNKIDNQRKKFIHYKVNFKDDGLFNNNIRSFFEDSKGYIWVGTKDGGGLSRFDPKTGLFKHYKPNPSNPYDLADDYVFSINELDDRYLLVGTFRKGLEILDRQTDKFERFKAGSGQVDISNSRVYNIYKDLDGDVWVSTATHIDRVNYRLRTISHSVSIGRVWCFLPENKDSFWVGTSQRGLYQYNKKTGIFKSYNYASADSVALATHGISTIVKDEDGILWVGTYGGGIYACDTIGKIKNTYSIKQGLPSNKVCSMMLDDSGNIWISTTNGISKFDPRKESFINYTVQDGLQGNEFEIYVGLKTHEGDILFGGNNGFNIFTPSEIQSNKSEPDVVITGLKIFNKPAKIGGSQSPLKKHISQTKELKLKHKYSVFTIEFTALNFSSTDKNQYAYKLEGFEDEWNYVGTTRNATYTNLSAGDYTFRVIASNNDGTWNMNGTSLKIKVLPPIWKTFWAYLFYAVVLFYLINTWRKFSINRNKAKNELLLERLTHEKDNEVNQMKFKFFTNISHEFRTPLTLILGPTECLIEKDTNEENRSLLFTIRKNASILLHLVNQLMDLRKIDTGNMPLNVSKGDVMVFIEETARTFDILAQEHSIKFTITKNPEKFEMWFDSDKMATIIINLLGNAFKYTKDQGEISVIVNVIDNNEFKNLELKFQDTGIGIPKESIDIIFKRFYQVKKSNSNYYEGTGIGLSLVNDLVTLMNGEISVESEENKGSSFTVRIPIEERYNAHNLELEIKESNKGKRVDRIRNYAVTTLEKTPPLSVDLSKNQSPIDAPVILIVDDNVDIRNFIIQQLQQFYCFEQANNGFEGLEKAIEFQPDLIISDVLMPEMNGIELCKQLKTEIQTSHIPIILLTALTSTEYAIEGFETGADAYISKPFEIDLLKAQIKNLVESRRKLRERFDMNILLQPKDITINSLDKDFLERAMEIIEKYMSNPDFDVQLFVNEIGMSRTVLYRKLRAVTGISINEFINTVRLKRAVQLLEQRKLSVSEIAYEVGFTSPKYFSTCFRKQFNKTPSDYISSLN